MNVRMMLQILNQFSNTFKNYLTKLAP